MNMTKALTEGVKEVKLAEVWGKFVGCVIATVVAVLVFAFYAALTPGSLSLAIILVIFVTLISGKVYGHIVAHRLQRTMITKYPELADEP